MAYHDDLIEHASSLNLPDDLKLWDNPRQVDLRRAVSAAYYALFHLLTTEAAQNWKHESQRSRFARMYDHRKTKDCSSKVSSRPVPSDPAEIPIARNLKLVAASFVKLQEARHTADYDNSRVWSRTQVAETIVRAQEAMDAWMAIREKEMAQEYLLDLMGIRS
jgi:uncharacterized protein (UPF0332 family)